ncbi:hypothetical protein EMWEY_00017390, partial [Eimeria maxima]
MDSSAFQLAFQGRAHSAAVRCCCLLPNGLLLTGSLDSTVVVWRQQKEEQQQQPAAPSTSCGGTVGNDGSSSGNGSRIGNGGSLGCMYSPEKVLQHHKDFVLCVSPSSLPGQFFSGSKDQTLCRGHKSAVCSVAERKDVLASGDWAGEARVWHRDEGVLLHVLKQHHAFAVCLCWLGEELVTGSQAKTICFWTQKGELRNCVE